MKNQIIWILICAAFLCACTSKNEPEEAQQDKAYFMDSIWYYSQGILMKKDIINRLPDGRYAEYLHYEYIPDNGQWMLSSKTKYFTWSSSGEPTNYIEYIYTDSEWVPKVQYSQKTTSEGWVSTAEYKVWDGKDWKMNLLYTYTHTDRGDVKTREARYFYDDGIYYSAIKNQYFYRDNILDSLYFYSRSDQIEPFSLDGKNVFLAYDEKGNCTKQKTYFWSNDCWIISEESTTSYQYLDEPNHSRITEYTKDLTYYDEEGKKSSSSKQTIKYFYSKH